MSTKHTPKVPKTKSAKPRSDDPLIVTHHEGYTAINFRPLTAEERAANKARRMQEIEDALDCGDDARGCGEDNE